MRLEIHGLAFFFDEETMRSPRLELLISSEQTWSSRILRAYAYIPPSPRCLWELTNINTRSIATSSLLNLSFPISDTSAGTGHQQEGLEIASSGGSQYDWQLLHRPAFLWRCRDRECCLGLRLPTIRCLLACSEGTPLYLSRQTYLYLSITREVYSCSLHCPLR